MKHTHLYFNQDEFSAIWARVLMKLNHNETGVYTVVPSMETATYQDTFSEKAWIILTRLSGSWLMCTWQCLPSWCQYLCDIRVKWESGFRPSWVGVIVPGLQKFLRERQIRVKPRSVHSLVKFRPFTGRWKKHICGVRPIPKPFFWDSTRVATHCFPYGVWP